MNKLIFTIALLFGLTLAPNAKALTIDNNFGCWFQVTVFYDGSCAPGTSNPMVYTIGPGASFNDGATCPIIQVIISDGASTFTCMPGSGCMPGFPVNTICGGSSFCPLISEHHIEIQACN